jgi:hypothetical protein
MNAHIIEESPSILTTAYLHESPSIPIKSPLGTDSTHSLDTKNNPPHINTLENTPLFSTVGSAGFCCVVCCVSRCASVAHTVCVTFSAFFLCVRVCVCASSVSGVFLFVAPRTFCACSLALSRSGADSTHIFYSAQGSSGAVVLGCWWCNDSREGSPQVIFKALTVVKAFECGHRFSKS